MVGVGYGNSCKSVFCQHRVFIWIVFKTKVCLLYPKRGPKNTEMLFYGDSCPFERRDCATCSKKAVLCSV